jgi:hypothetical protein
VPAAGARLTILAGPTVPVPLPAPVTARLRSAVVTETDEERSVFTLTFDAGRGGASGGRDAPLIAQSPIGANTRIVLLVSLGAVPVVLMDGIVTSVELTPGSGAGTATLTATGEDLSLLLDRQERDVEHPGLDDYLQVLAVLAPYATRGLLPVAVPPLLIDPPLPIERVPTQHDTDLRHLQMLAERHGYVAYVDPGPLPGASRFYWGPPVRVGAPQRAISVDLGPSTNVTSPPRFRQDALEPVAVEGRVQDPRTGSTMPVRAVRSLRPPLAALPLSAVAPSAVRTRRLRESGTSTTGALARAQAQVDRSADGVVVGEGELDAARYGGVLRPRGLVGVRGAGWSHDGLWYVRKVEHELSRGGYKQRFTVAREGYGSTVPVVPV